MGDIRRSLADISAAAADLHYTDLVDIQAGLKKTILWYQQQINS
jgi:nucleoside-diphosphate-sugar epimerase